MTIFNGNEARQCVLQTSYMLHNIWWNKVCTTKLVIGDCSLDKLQGLYDAHHWKNICKMGLCLWLSQKRLPGWQLISLSSIHRVFCDNHPSPHNWGEWSFPLILVRDGYDNSMTYVHKNTVTWYSLITLFYTSIEHIAQQPELRLCTHKIQPILCVIAIHVMSIVHNEEKLVILNPSKMVTIFTVWHSEQYPYRHKEIQFSSIC